jgi:hypothetical protein
MIRFAKPERQADHEVGSDIADDILRDRFGVGKQLRHQLRTRGIAGEPAALNRTPASEAIAYLPPNFVCDEPATAKRLFHGIHVLMSRGSLPVAATPPKQVNAPRLSAGADKAMHDRE